ncbi:MAG: NAD-binding protein [Gammaproteobacteria bacterium]|nr:NAD-binding protein [Gammaproteobacteria bacterium]
MSSPIFIVLQRLRYPLLLLVIVYSVLILVFTIIPGVDDKGNPWTMSFFHAFYFVSFMGSTIGFGEIPYPFSDGQRFWALFGIYASVISWLYSIGRLLQIIKDPAFQLVLTESMFSKRVNRINEPFYLICGYGDTGKLLARGLSELDIRCVVLDKSQQRIDDLAIEENDINIPSLCANAIFPEVLELAGLKHPKCVGVLALTHDNQVNLKIAITSKLLSKNINVISRADTNDVMANMDSFDTDHIINPYQMFAKRLALAIRSPEAYLVYEWFTNADHRLIDEPPVIPKGKWLICGYGRFGKSVSQYLEYEGIRTKIVEARPQQTDAPGDVVVGSGTEAITLKDAGIMDASGVVAGTDNDSNNLSIIMTAKEIKKHHKIFTVARQNYHRNSRVFDAAELDLVMQPAIIVVREILALIKTPLLSEFLTLVTQQKKDWINILISRLSGIFDSDTPHVWTVSTSSLKSSSVKKMISEDHICIEDLLKNINNRDRKLSCLALFIKNKHHGYKLLPDLDQIIEVGDEILFCGDHVSEDSIHALLKYDYMLRYVKDGTSYRKGYVWNYFFGSNKPGIN